jgi:hypothetical protein
METAKKENEQEQRMTKRASQQKVWSGRLLSSCALTLTTKKRRKTDITVSRTREPPGRGAYCPSVQKKQSVTV